MRVAPTKSRRGIFLSSPRERDSLFCGSLRLDILFFIFFPGSVMSLGAGIPLPARIAAHVLPAGETFPERNRVSRGTEQQYGVVGGGDAIGHDQGIEVNRLA